MADFQERKFETPYYQIKPGFQVADITDNLDFNLGCVIKYVWRAGKKENESKEKDLNKALDYLSRELELLKKGCSK